MPGVLGSGDNRAAIYSRGGGSELLKLDAVSGLEWGRARNVFSTATVTVTADDSNWRDLGQLTAWGQELVIFRDGERVWEGPIRLPDWGTSDTVLYAVDVLGWLSKRRIRVKRQTTKDHDARVTDELELILTRAFQDGDPNVLAHRLVLHHADEALVARDVRANSGMYDADLTSLAGKGGNFTTIGRRAIIWPDEVLVGRTGTLIPENHTTTGARVRESGDDLATSVTFTDADGRARRAVADDPDVNPTTGVSAVYSRHDRIVTVEGSSTNAALTAMARSAIGQLFPAPVQIVMPGDSSLKPTAPFAMGELVPGVLVPVSTSATPRRADGSFILDNLKVTQDSSGETVTVGLVTASAYAGTDG